MSKLSDAEAEADETRVWLEFATECDYLSPEEASSLEKDYDRILARLWKMISNPEQWTLKT